MSIENITYCNGSLISVFPTLVDLTKLIGLAFVDFYPIMLFIPSQVFFQVSQVSIKSREVILLFSTSVR